MKKLVSVVLALVLLFALAVSASALTATVSYEDGVLSWNVTEFEGSVGVYVNGAQVGGSAQGKKSIKLKAGDEPKATFHKGAERGTVYAYCNLHGLWKA